VSINGGKMNKEKTGRVLDYFEELFPNAYCELNHETDFQLLVAVMLSAQTTDKKVNQLTETLFKKYPTVEAVSQASISELEQDIKTIGLYRNKAKNLLAMSKVLIEEFNGKVPSVQKELESLPGVGRKTANVVRSVAFDIPAFAVDTHVERISKRLGFAKKEDSVLTVEKKLCRSIDRSRWNKSHHQFIFFGRYFCKATNPNCQECKLSDMCKDPIKKKYLEKVKC
jgi:endonuclease-3